MTDLSEGVAVDAFPLAGCRILVTADRRAGDLCSALRRQGAAIVHAPALSIVPHADDQQLLRDTLALVEARPDIVIVTTGVGLRGWLEAADASGYQAPLHDALAGARILARGPKALGAIRAAQLDADWVAPSETNAEIAERLLAEGVAGLTIAVQHHGAGSDGLDEALTAGGARVLPVVVYRWADPDDPGPLRQAVDAVGTGVVDATVFTAAPGVAAFLSAAGRQGHLGEVMDAFRTRAVIAAAVGPVTARPLLESGIEPLVPARWRLGSLVRALAEEFDVERRGLATASGTLVVRRTGALVDGRLVELSPATGAVLRALAAEPGAVVSREQLAATLPGAQAGLHAAEVAVGRLRDALRVRDLIETVVKRGYRLRANPLNRD